MTAQRIPTIRGALVTGPAAYALARVIDRDEVAERLSDCGLGESWQEVALAALEAIDLEAAAWRRETTAQRRRQRDTPSAHAEADLRERNPKAESRPVESPPSSAMNVLTATEAAGRLNVTPRQVRTLAATGRLPGRRHGRAWLIDAAAVTARAAERHDERKAA